MKKFLFGLAPLLAVAAFTLPPSAAASAPCAKTTVLCDGANNALRDDFTIEPKSTIGELGTVEGAFGTSVLDVNTHGPLRLCATIGGLKTCNENPAGYAFFGLKVDKNATSSATKCEEATGWVEFVDIQNAKSGVNSSPVYGGEGFFKPAAPARGGLGPWPVSIKSDEAICGAEAGKVTISNVSLYFSKLLLTVTGVIVGRYIQPNMGTPHTCPAGGVEIATGEQKGLKLSAGSKPEIDNGTAAKAGFICNVSSNNWFFPKTAPTWEPFEDFNASAEPGIWKD